VRRILLVFAFVASSLATVLSGPAAVATPQRQLEAAPAAVPAQALAPSASQFDPGFIISDANFYDGNAMSASDVQAFLNSKVGACTGSVPCLKNLRADTWNIAATPMCSAYQGAPQETAATIIYKVGRACGVSQAAILVMLQKEQSLVTNPAPTLRAISAAMGVGCYDNGQPCVDEYSGFFNQLFNGAYLLRRYTQPAGTGAGTPYPTRFDLSYPVGQTSQILYHPNRDCGTKAVTIRNQATHALYVYTPYTPNASALANLYGTGDACASYGNRNFWRLYWDWFGDPTTSRIPTGWLDSVGLVGSQVTAAGWAFDADTADPVPIDLTIDGAVVASVLADREYPGLETVYPAAGSRRGFEVTATTTAGTHQVCVVARNDGVGDDRGLGCKTVTVALSNAPIGWLDSVTVAATQVAVVGWAIDTDTADPIQIEITVDGGAPQRFPANVVRPGFGGSFPGFGDAHGFSATVAVSAGHHTVCVTALDHAGGAPRALGCRAVTVVTGNAPLGWLDSVRVVGTTVTASGWALDRDTLGPVSVRVTIDGVARTALADRPYAGLGSVHVGYGDDHGFAVEATLSAGSHTVCVTALNDGAGGDRDLGCRTVTVTVGNVPIGWIDSVRTDYQTVTVAGWALDHDTPAPIRVAVDVDGGTPTVVTADVVKPGFGSVNPGYGDRHGFIAEVQIPVGPHTVCVTALDDGAGASRSLGCRSVVGVSRPPLGWVDGVTTLGTMATVNGWAIDRDSTGPIRVRAVFDGSTVVEQTADVDYPGLGGVHVGFGDAHGFAVTAALAPGAHTVCVTALNDSAGGPEQSIGCRSFTTAGGNAPIGWLDDVQVATRAVTPVGWTIDPDTASPISIDVVVDGVVVATQRADGARPGLGGIFRGFGDDHGFGSAVSVAAGTHQVCVVARNDSGSTHPSIGCRTVVVP